MTLPLNTRSCGHGATTHVAMDVNTPDSEAAAAKVAAAAPRWCGNWSESASRHVLSPDEHKLELRVGS